jgi:hypothetical protein
MTKNTPLMGASLLGDGSVGRSSATDKDPLGEEIDIPAPS